MKIRATAAAVTIALTGLVFTATASTAESPTPEDSCEQVIRAVSDAGNAYASTLAADLDRVTVERDRARETIAKKDRRIARLQARIYAMKHGVAEMVDVVPARPARR
ncbi:hypothetical protein [Nocardioides sp.]|uniref:hypothetical protein n=1 Tax=Nocardioides sp. TaxID=35761 RepID=UPI0039E26D02